MSRRPSHPEERSALAHIDWLSFTIPRSENRWLGLWDELAPMLGAADIPLVAHKSGFNGYDHRQNIGPKAEYGLIAYGGKSQRGSVHVSLNAHACARVANWQALREWGEAVGARISRIDLAHDDRDGKTVNLAIARQWLENGEFNANGRPPKRKLVDDLGSGEGSTLYVGDRKNGKLARLYEKGRQLGDKLSQWFRVEVELRGKDRVIPWDALTRPGAYLAGAYPCFAFLSVVQDKIRTMKAATAVVYDGMVGWVQTAAGAALHAMMLVHRGDALNVMQILMSNRLPRRLIDLDRYLPRLDGGKGEDHALA